MADQPQQQPPEPEPEPELAVQQQQWEGSVEARLPSTPAAAAWPHVASFCTLHRYLPGINVCERVAGEDGVPGCVRYVASRPPAEADQLRGEEAAPAGEAETWAREELLERDDARRRLVYGVVGSNMGFGRYVSTMTIVGNEEEEHANAPAAAAGCRLLWAFECEPVQGWTRDGLVGYIDAAAKGMAERIEVATAGGDAAADCS
ncbi:hypothetical protein E2562_038099 [Oryza meyeriana var. granulata]|uniref:Bet v I/Major latex protein domain-containing protein n=1 Tax=Oryza meyeriana var. granulata TaxID=110450 RepID=A0A6G1EU76_9ORYZ|nr:hypothetical protein E2562_038099 [Oryza meyeriana var. granulata]